MVSTSDRRIFLADRFGALHFLKPVREEVSDAILHQWRSITPRKVFGARKW